MNNTDVVVNQKTFANPRIKKADMNAEVTTEAIEIITMQVDKNMQERSFEVSLDFGIRKCWVVESESNARRSLLRLLLLNGTATRFAFCRLQRGTSKSSWTRSLALTGTVSSVKILAWT